jgi:hypothetical protein
MGIKSERGRRAIIKVGAFLFSFARSHGSFAHYALPQEGQPGNVMRFPSHRLHAGRTTWTQGSYIKLK